MKTFRFLVAAVAMTANSLRRLADAAEGYVKAETDAAETMKTALQLAEQHARSSRETLDAANAVLTQIEAALSRRSERTH